MQCISEISKTKGLERDISRGKEGRGEEGKRGEGEGRGERGEGRGERGEGRGERRRGEEGSWGGERRIIMIQAREYGYPHQSVHLMVVY